MGGLEGGKVWEVDDQKRVAEEEDKDEEGRNSCKEETGEWRINKRMSL